MKHGTMIWGTVCGTLWVATVGIVVLMALGVNVAKEVSLAVAGQWGALLGVAYKRGHETYKRGR